MKYPKDTAIEIVGKNYLDIANFIKKNKKSITSHLKGFMEKSKSHTEEKLIQQKIPESVEVLSEVLPFMSGIVNVGAQPTNYEKAKKFVEHQCEQEKKCLSASVIYILSIYTFIYIVEQGLMEDKPNKDMWTYFKAQAHWLCNVTNDEATDVTASQAGLELSGIPAQDNGASVEQRPVEP